MAGFSGLGQLCFLVDCVFNIYVSFNDKLYSTTGDWVWCRWPRLWRLCTGFHGRWVKQIFSCGDLSTDIVCYVVTTTIIIIIIIIEEILKTKTCWLNPWVVSSVRFSWHIGEQSVSSWTGTISGMCHTSSHPSAVLLFRWQSGLLLHRSRQLICPRCSSLEEHCPVPRHSVWRFHGSQQSGKSLLRDL